MLINMDLVRAKEKPGKSKYREGIRKLGWPIVRCRTLREKLSCWGGDTQAQTRPAEWEVKPLHFQPKKTHPIYKRIGAQTSRTSFR